MEWVARSREEAYRYVHPINPGGAPCPPCENPVLVLVLVHTAHTYVCMYVCKDSRQGPSNVTRYSGVTQGHSFVRGSHLHVT